MHTTLHSCLHIGAGFTLVECWSNYNFLLHLSNKEKYIFSTEIDLMMEIGFVVKQVHFKGGCPHPGGYDAQGLSDNDNCELIYRKPCKETVV